MKSSKLHDADNTNVNSPDATDAAECNTDIIEQGSNEVPQEASTPTVVEDGCKLSTSENGQVSMIGDRMHSMPQQENQYYYFYQGKEILYEQVAFLKPYFVLIGLCTD